MFRSSQCALRTSSRPYERLRGFGVQEGTSARLSKGVPEQNGALISHPHKKNKQVTVMKLKMISRFVICV